MANSVLFDYEVKSFADVVVHLDALWDTLNQISAAAVCSDPPGTCANAAQSQRKRPKKKPAKRYVKR
jgi:hypothetical protein